MLSGCRTDRHAAAYGMRYAVRNRTIGILNLGLGEHGSVGLWDGSGDYSGDVWDEFLAVQFVGYSVSSELAGQWMLTTVTVAYTPSSS